MVATRPFLRVEGFAKSSLGFDSSSFAESARALVLKGSADAVAVDAGLKLRL